jgi:hypothetical protein
MRGKDGVAGKCGARFQDAKHSDIVILANAGTRFGGYKQRGCALKQQVCATHNKVKMGSRVRGNDG